MWVGSVALTVLLTVSHTVRMDTVVTTPAEHPRGWAPPWAAAEASRRLNGTHLALLSAWYLSPLNKEALGNSGYTSLEGCAEFSVTTGNHFSFNYF